MKPLRGIKVACAVLAPILALAACKAEEQGRNIDFKPGVYLGKPDTQLSESQVRQLRQRASLQAGADTFSVSGSPFNVSAIQSTAIDSRTLRKLYHRGAHLAGAPVRFPADVRLPETDPLGLEKPRRRNFKRRGAK